MCNGLDAEIRINIEGCKIRYWKHTYHIALPDKTGFWGETYLAMTEVNAREILEKQVRGLLAVFEAGKKAKCKEIQRVIQIKEPNVRRRWL